MATVLRTLLSQRHIHSHAAFLSEYDRCARVLDAGLVGGGPTKTQYYRWLSGALRTNPRGHHCRVLEAMFPGRTVAQLLATDAQAVDADVAGLVRRFYADLWNRSDDAAADELLDADFVYEGADDECCGRHDWADYRDRIRSAIPDFHIELRDLLIDGERAAARVRCTGHRPSGVLGRERPVDITAAAFFTTGGGLLTLCRAVGGPDVPLRRRTSWTPPIIKLSEPRNDPDPALAAWYDGQEGTLSLVRGP
ncbi:MAG: SnoaL-like domain-containing protein [Mycobacteriaceae bacterium]|nr:SnoaL-like domain-containing protein [Streptomycetaceae bacterium]NUS42363.1 SnoaL-like domain-containing protein [Mycobacteriaceae bacterium]